MRAMFGASRRRSGHTESGAGRMDGEDAGNVARRSRASLRGRSQTPAGAARMGRDLWRGALRTGGGAALVVAIMIIGSLVLWVGTPLLWLWIGSQIQGATASLGAALGAMMIGIVATIAFLAA